MSALRRIAFTLNGRGVTADVAPHHTLVEMLQEQFHLYGARESCAQGLCGCCTVIVDGRSVSGCLYLAAFVDQADVVTIEGLAQGERLDPVQESFVSCSGFQCGFCTSGFILMARQLLEQNANPTEEEIRHYLSGNLCRCATYPDIITAVHAAATTLRKE